MRDTRRDCDGGTLSAERESAVAAGQQPRPCDQSARGPVPGIESVLEM